MERDLAVCIVQLPMWRQQSATHRNVWHASHTHTHTPPRHHANHARHSPGSSCSVPDLLHFRALLDKLEDLFICISLFLSLLVPFCCFIWSFFFFRWTVSCWKTEHWGGFRKNKKKTRVAGQLSNELFSLECRSRTGTALQPKLY